MVYQLREDKDFKYIFSKRFDDNKKEFVDDELVFTITNPDGLGDILAKNVAKHYEIFGKKDSVMEAVYAILQGPNQSEKAYIEDDRGNSIGRNKAVMDKGVKYCVLYAMSVMIENEKGPLVSGEPKTLDDEEQNVADSMLRRIAFNEYDEKELAVGKKSLEWWLNHEAMFHSLSDAVIVKSALEYLESMEDKNK